MAGSTKDKIRESFMELLEEKPLAKITVRDIVERCGVNRNSFYYHYQDIPSLLEELTVEAADGIIKKYPTVDSIETAFLAAVEFAAQNRRALMHVYRSANRDIFEQHLWKVCDHVVYSYAEKLFQGGKVSEENRDVICGFFRCACFGMAIEWMNRGMKDDAPERIRRLCRLQAGMVEEMIRRAGTE